VQGVTSREIVEAAGQRNTSAVTYHFGTRDGLLLEILARRGGPVDGERGRLRDRLPAKPSVHDLVECLVVPYVALLDEPASRSYVQIVAQLRGRFAAWRVESDAATTRHLARVLDELESRPKASAAVRRERVVGMIMLLTGTVAERARRIDDGVGNETGDTEFAANVVAMCTAVLTA
jgi:AcrR family transcriptional regulator